VSVKMLFEGSNTPISKIGVFLKHSVRLSDATKNVSHKTNVLTTSLSNDMQQSNLQ